MNPTLNKSDFEDLTTSLRDLAYSYLEKYSPSKQQLKVYLLKKYLTKIKGSQSKKEVTSLIDEIIENLAKDEKSEVRYAVATNSKTSTRILNQLSYDKDQKVIEAVENHPKNK